MSEKLLVDRDLMERLFKIIAGDGFHEELEIDQLLAALKAGQGEAVYVVPVTGSLDEIDAPVWPFINAEAQKVGAEHGRIETYKYERANGGVAVLWDANRIHAMAVTIRDDMNRTRCIRMLTATPATADAVSVPDEFHCESKPLQNLLNATAMLLESPCPDSATYWCAALAEVESLLARQEVKL